MDNLAKAIGEIPLFRHCNHDEIEHLKSICKISSVMRGQRLEVKKLNSLCVVVGGIFEIETHGRGENLFLYPGSFFGEIPFVEARSLTTVKAAIDSTVVLFSTDDLYKFLFMFYRAMRGYFKSLDYLGFEITDYGKKFKSLKTKVVTVFSNHAKAGKSLFASFLALSLSRHDSVILLDMSYEGDSLFNILNRKITPPLSEREKEITVQEEFINERIEKIDEHCDILNVTHGSKVKTNPDIISPLLLLLSKNYNYIIIDLSDADIDLRNKVFELSDIIFPIIRKRKELGQLYGTMDLLIKDGQRIYYVLNKFFSPEINEFEGGFLLHKIDIKDINREKSDTANNADTLPAPDFVQAVVREKMGLVLQSNMLESLYFSGLFSLSQAANMDFKILYASGMSYFIASLFLFTKDITDAKRVIKKLMSSTGSLLSITFPEENIFKNNKILRFNEEITNNKRIEWHTHLPVLLASDVNYNKRVFSTGYCKDMLTISLLSPEIFEPLEVMNDRYSSGYPAMNVSTNDLFRLDLDDIYYAGIKGNIENVFDVKTIGFYPNYLKYIYELRKTENNLIDNDHFIELRIDKKVDNIDALFKASEEEAVSIFEKIKLKR